VPACGGERAIGCVIAWSTFNEEPPSNSRYGREPAEDTSGFGFPSGADYEVVCTNPASLGANERRPLTTYLRGQPFPGAIGALLVAMYGGPQPSAPTAFIRPADRYSGRCERRNDANVLMIEPIGNSRKLNPSPSPDWGLHLADGNIALGDLVETVERQAGAYGGTGGLSRLEFSVAYSSGRYGSRRRCARPPVRLAILSSDTTAVTRVAFSVGPKRIATDTRAPFGTRVARGAVRPRSVAKLIAEATLADGRSGRLVRHVRICGQSVR
jgi:Protein of unknown function (DUF3089)